MLNRFAYPLAPLALALGLISGCAMKPEAQHIALELPASYTVATQAAEAIGRDHMNWYQRYHDAELNRLIALALRQQEGMPSAVGNQEIERAIAQYDKAQAFFSQTEATRWPQIGLSADGQKTSANTGGHRQHAVNQRVRGMASFELDLWSKLANRSESGRQQLLASEYNIAAVKRAIIHQIVSQYWLLRQLEAEELLIHRQIEARRDQLAIVEARYKLGMDTALDVEQTTAKMASLNRARIETATQRALVEQSLAILTGTPSLTVSPGGDEPSQPIELPLTGTPSQLMLERPDIRQAEARLKAAGFDISAARAALFPQISLTAQGGGQAPALSSILDAGSSFWTLGYTLDVPIFDRGLRMAQIDEARAVERERIAEYQQTVLAAFADVRQAVANLDGVSSQKPWLANELSAAERALQIATARYREGSIEYAEVLDTQQAMDNARRDEVRLRYAELIHQADFMHSLGF